MKPGPPWLAELHRQWLAARGRRAAGAVKAYARDWEPLLDAAGLHTAEERAAAAREAAAMAGEGRVVLARHLASGRKGDFEQEGRKMVLPGG